MGKTARIVSGAVAHTARWGRYEVIALTSVEATAYTPYVITVERSSLFVMFLHPYFTAVRLYKGGTFSTAESAAAALTFVANAPNGYTLRGPEARFPELRKQFALVLTILDPDKHKCEYDIAIDEKEMSLAIDHRYLGAAPADASLHDGLMTAAWVKAFRRLGARLAPDYVESLRGIAAEALRQEPPGG